MVKAMQVRRGQFGRCPIYWARLPRALLGLDLFVISFVLQPAINRRSHPSGLGSFMLLDNCPCFPQRKVSSSGKGESANQGGQRVLESYHQQWLPVIYRISNYRSSWGRATPPTVSSSWLRSVTNLDSIIRSQSESSSSASVPPEPVCC